MLSAADALLCLIIHLNMYMIQRHQQNPNKAICGSSEPRHQYSKLSLTAWWRTGGHSDTWKDTSLGSSKCKVSGFTQVTWQFLNQMSPFSGLPRLPGYLFLPLPANGDLPVAGLPLRYPPLSILHLFFRFQDFWSFLRFQRLTWDHRNGPTKKHLPETLRSKATFTFWKFQR